LESEDKAPLHLDLGPLSRLASASRAEERLESLRIMRRQIEAGCRPKDYLDLACHLVGDTDNDCRWQALIVVGEYIETCPDTVWQIVCEHGISQDEDMRDGVATVLLEHLLEHHFDAYFPRLKERIEGGEVLLADTLARCWAFGQAVSRWAEVQALAARSGAESPP
jgi:hypothetical protein